jgi:teichuronic acid biosynthesis glycosyltransferase TuaC
MKILVVCSGNSGNISPFIEEQVEAVRSLGADVGYFQIYGKGMLGYMKNLMLLKHRIKSFKPDLIHAHYGLSGFLVILAQQNLRIVCTFHGNDINNIIKDHRRVINWNKLISRLVYKFSDYSIFVAENLALQIGAKPKKSDIIPCQVDLSKFFPVDKKAARMKMNMSLTKQYVIFSSSFTTPIKNYKLARVVCNRFEDMELIELKGYTREQVNLLLNACDLALLTSFNEGSNQFIKEAMACNRPIVSTRVGDSDWVFGDTEGCYLTSFEPGDVADKIKHAINFSYNIGCTRGRERIIKLGLDSETIGTRIYSVYRNVVEIEYKS